MLPTAVHIGEQPYYGGMHRITNDKFRDSSHDKPYGGLWCSTLHPVYGTDWLRACEEVLGGAWSWHGNHAGNRTTRGNKEHHAYAVVAHEDARVLHIEDEEDYEIVCELYPRTSRNFNISTQQYITIIDWEAVSKDYDVVYVHKAAQRWMRDWDAETILFMNYKWDCIGIHEFAEKQRVRRCDNA